MKKYRIGYTDGTFDMFHVGHLNLIEQAKAYSERLIVGVHSDETVFGYKNQLTVISETDRVRIIESIKGVDKAIITPTRDKVALHKLVGFDVIFIGDDWQGTERWIEFERQLKPLGVDVVYIPYTQSISSTLIREKLKGCGKNE